jgi:CMP-N-acetylneuraminic acid synthetase
LPDYFALLQPTSPLRTAAHLDRCIEGLLRSDASCAISVTEAEHHPFKAFFLDRGKLKPLHERRSLHQPRQALPPVVRQNGAIYVLGTKRFLQERSFYVEPAIPFFMNAEDSVDIDSAFDLRVAELLTRPRPPAEAVAAGKCDA